MKLILIPLAVIFLWCGAQAQADKPAFKNLDVFELEYADDPQISPDGKSIVYVRRGMDIMTDRAYGRLWMLNSDGTDHRKLTAREVNESNPRWSPSGDRIAFVSSSENGSEIYVLWADTQQLAKITELDGSPSGLSWSPDGTHIAFSLKVDGKKDELVKPPKKPKDAKWAEAPRVTTLLKHERDGSGYISPGFSHFFVVPADGSTARQVSSGDYHHSGTPQWSPDGRSLVFSGNRTENWEFEFRNSEIYKLDLETGSIEVLTDRNGPDHSPTISPNGKQVAYLGFEDKIQTYQIDRLFLMDLDGSNKREIDLNLDRSISNPSWAKDGNGIYFQYDNHGNTKIGYVSLGGKVEKIADNLGGTGIGRPYGGGSFTLSEDDVITYTFCTPYHPADVAVISNTEVSVLTHLNADLLDHRELGEFEEVWYTSTFDQRALQGWIVKPPKFEPANRYPLMVEIHGGPVSNYGDRFSAEMQLAASAGYVVFYPNFRGSTGYGEEFGNLLYNNYPGDDYQDIMDGVDVMIAKDYIDEDQLFVTGGSAGGIMSAWIIGKNHRFRAASVVKPVMNWISKTLTADNYYGYANYRIPGQPWENFEDYWKFSPISLVGNVETPTLVMVGMEDLRTPISEAKQLYHALKLRKIPTAFVEIPGSYHNIANRPSQLITKVEHTLAWFEKYRKE
ncbi:MAG: S9 family peptidase [Verrucomicrobia bacterium]|nr:S9 family peptidase [Verrucomicrobiota bacterium]MDA1066465.1 S9 family peptidase [Verrucomicrobiota bacterium]